MSLHLSWQILQYATPIAFYEYETCVMSRIVESERSYDKPDHDLQEFENALYEKFQAASIDARRDNKVAFEMDYHGQTFYIGFYDNVMSIGLHCRRTWGGNRPIYPASKLPKNHFVANELLAVL